MTKTKAKKAPEPTLPKINAVFRPQEWHGDNAVDIAGREQFDCTEAVLMTEASTINHFRFHDSHTDDLASFYNVGDDHTGPFEVDVDENEWRAFWAYHDLNPKTVEDIDLVELRQKYRFGEFKDVVPKPPPTMADIAIDQMVYDSVQGIKKTVDKHADLVLTDVQEEEVNKYLSEFFESFRKHIDSK